MGCYLVDQVLLIQKNRVAVIKSFYIRYIQRYNSNKDYAGFRGHSPQKPEINIVAKLECNKIFKKK